MCGLLSAVACELGHLAVCKARIDDPLDAFAVHGCAGMAGLLLHPLLTFSGPDTKMLSGNLVGMLAIMVWSGGFTALTFAAMNVLGLLRPTEEEHKRHPVKMYKLHFRGTPKASEATTPTTFPTLVTSPVSRKAGKEEDAAVNI